MTEKKRAYSRLDNMLAGLEEDVLALDDRKLCAESRQLFGSVRSVREVIAAGLQVDSSIEEPPAGREADRVRGRTKRAWHDIPSIRVPSSIAEKRRLLAELFAERSGISGELRMAFSARKTLSDSEVDAMVERLFRLGLLHREDTQDDT